MHDEIANELEARQQELNDRLKLLTSDNKSFQVTASYLLDLAQRSAELFRTSDEALQQKLLEYVLSNIELNDKKLSYILNDPFKTIFETKKKSLHGSNSNVWCGSGSFYPQVKNLWFLLADPARGLAEWLDSAPPVRVPRN